MRKVTHLFFDLGGTLVDLRGLVPAMERVLLAEHPNLGARAGAIARGWFKGTAEATSRAQGPAFRVGLVLTGEELVEALARAGVHTGFDSAVESVRRACRSYLPRARLYEDASRAVLRSLRSLVMALGIITDSDEYLVRPLISRLRLGDLFDVIVVSEMLHTYKPDARIYRAALKEAGATAATSVFVSDSVTDLDGAASVGMGTVWIRRNGDTGLARPPKTVVLKGLRQLEEVLVSGRIP